jgi:hypothetical protein
MPKDITDVNGNPAIETDEPLSIQEANEWAIETRGKADPLRAAIERLKCAAAKRRERVPTNPLETLKPDTRYKVGEFNPEADAFNVESSDGKKLLGKSLSNGNVRNGQKVRSFFTPDGQVVIDVKPKGRDIIIPKPLTKIVADEEIWPCTVGFLHCEINSYTEDLTDNGLATGDETSWDWNKFNGFSSSDLASKAYIFGQQFNTLGDYATGADALANRLKPDRLIVPSGESGGAKDNGAIASGSADAVTVWFYIGNPSNALTDGRICKVSGTPMHPSAGNVTSGGPGFCMEVYRGGFACSCIFPQEAIGQGPLTQYLQQSFPNLGGRIGYAGRIERWRGMQDYNNNGYISYFRSVPNSNNPNQIPTSTPSWYTPNSNTNPWLYTNGTWYEFGWPEPQFIGCASSSWVNIDASALTAMTGCGGVIAPDKWYWGGDATPNYGRIDKNNPSGYIGVTGMFVCWQGHKDNEGLAQSFFEAFKTYWGIAGSVTRLGAVNLYGCELPNNGGYPPAPPAAPAQRYLARYFGRKAKIYLTINKGSKSPLILKLPIEFAACTERVEVIGGGSFLTGANFEAGKSVSLVRTYSQMFYYEDPFALELVHATLSIDDKFAYIDVFCGGERIRETPQTKPVRARLANLGFGPSQEAYERRLGTCDTEPIVGEYESASSRVREPRVVKDCFSACHSFVVRLPEDKEENLTIVAYQKYKRGEIIALTAAGQDNEFNNKFLIRDYRTDVLKYKNDLQSNPRWTMPNQEFASFGGLPALTQIPYYDSNNISTFERTFYKPQTFWTQMDWIHWHLQEGPKQFSHLTTVLPQNVQLPRYEETGIFFEFDKKFGRHARAECVMPTASFGWNNAYSGGNPPQYNDDYWGSFLLFTSFSEQQRGNGLKKDGKINRWYRISASSFPIHGQLTRNG